MPKLVFAAPAAVRDEPPAEQRAPWRVLIVDDEPEVHSVTELALRKLIFDRRSLEFLHAYSGAEARQVLVRHSDVALILLDVVMETDDAGLAFVEHVRSAMGNAKVRIVLRTGQPGQAPESDVIIRYDINDYKAKTELTQQRLFTTVITALRGFKDLTVIETSRDGLSKIIEASASLMQTRSMERFAGGVLTQLGGLLGATGGGILCTQQSDGNGLAVLAASGRFDLPDGGRAVADPVVRARIDQALAERRTIIGPGHTLLYLRTANAREVVVYVEAERPLAELDRSLIEVFGVNISVGFDNLEMFEQLVRTKDELEQRVEERTRALQEREARLLTILEASPIGVAIMRRADAGLLFINPRLCQMLKISAEMATSASFTAVIADPSDRRRIVTQMTRNREINDTEALIRRFDGDTFWGLISARPMMMDGMGVMLVWLYDTTQRKVLEQELSRQAMTDHLTGIANRRHFLDNGHREFDRGRRYKRPLSILMLDIDHFKQVNDRYGHPVGDRVIVALAGICVEALRTCDFIGRLGGEEFGVILPDCALEAATSVAERIRLAIADFVLELEGGTRLHSTISIGVTMVGDGDADLTSALVRADHALYRSKQAGRNRVTAAAPSDAAPVTLNP